MDNCGPNDASIRMILTPSVRSTGPSEVQPYRSSGRLLDGIVNVHPPNVCYNNHLGIAQLLATERSKKFSGDEKSLKWLT